MYLDKNTRKLFDDYLVNSQDEYDGAKETWGQWDYDDHHAEAMHVESTITGQKEAADKALKKFEMFH